MTLARRQRLGGLGVVLALVVLAAFLQTPGDRVAATAQPRVALPADAQAEQEMRTVPSAQTDIVRIAPDADDLERARRRLHPGERAPVTDAFAPHAWAEPVAEAAPRVEPPVVAAPPPALAPPLPFKYLGQLHEEGRAIVYLARGDAPIVAQVGETIEEAYRLERIADSVIEFTYLPMNERQSLVIGGLQ